MFIYGQPKKGRRGRGGRASSDGEEVARGLGRSDGRTGRPWWIGNDLEIDVPSGKLIWFNMVLIWFYDGMIME